MVMAPELKNILESEGVHADVITYFETIEFDTVAIFANLGTSETDARVELKDIHLAATSQKDNRGQVPRLLQSWKVCKARNDASLKRVADGASFEDPELPIDPLTAAALHSNFTKTTSWTLRARQVVDDMKLNKIKTETERKQPTLMPFLSVKTLAEGRRGAPPKRRKFGDMNVSFDNEEQDAPADVARLHLGLR